jgi:eukaryotic-like serine/threonine-protein kinase
MSEDDDLPRLLSGRYRLEATLGHGGMGVVYRGVDLMMKRAIAVKLIRAVDGVELDDEIAGRFLREAKNTARLQHEHIVEVFDLGRTDEGGMYFVMELLEGESLSSRIRREGKLSPQSTVHIGRQICEALAVAHLAGVVHRDLKPANVMLLSRAGDPDFVKVLDFGVAKSYGGDSHNETQLTATGMLVGTVDYMAPEQIMGKLVDGRTDVYALGVVLYKMLSGKAPFKDTGVPALIHAHLNTMPKPLMETVPGGGIPNELDLVVLRCLAKNPDRRYESMGELSRALSASILPPGSSLLDLEYNVPSDPKSNPDPYSTYDDQTVMGKGLTGNAPSPAAVPSAMSKPLPLDDATINEGGGNSNANSEIQFEDATVKMDRSLGFRRPTPAAGTPGPLPMTPRPPRPGGSNPPASPQKVPLPPRPMVYGEDVSTAKRGIPDEITRVDHAEPKPCAMCQTINPPHSRQCMACGVSLARPNQDAVYARVRVPTGPHQQPMLGAAGIMPFQQQQANMMPMPRTASTPAPPPVPPPSSDPFDTAAHLHQPRVPTPSSYPHAAPFGPATPMHGAPAVQWLPQQQHHPPQPEPSMWQRFLNWTGLRNR